MKGDEGDEVKMGEQAGLVFVPTLCPQCGAKDMDEADRLCRPSTDQTGERSCGGEFNEDGISVQPTPESLAELDRWCDEQGSMMEEDDRKRAPHIPL